MAATNTKCEHATEAAVLAAECVALETHNLSLLQDVETHRGMVHQLLSLLAKVIVQRNEASEALRAHRRADAERRRREWERCNHD